MNDSFLGLILNTSIDEERWLQMKSAKVSLKRWKVSKVR